MSKFEIIKRPEIPTPETIKIPEFGSVEIIPAVNGRAYSVPGEPKDFSQKEIDKALNNMRIKIVPQNEGAVKNYGGSFGPALALLEVAPEIAVKQVDNTVKWEKITPGQIVDLVNEWEISEGRKFTFYQNDQKEFGCDHVGKAKENPELYGLTKGKVNAMMRHVGEKLNNEEMIAEVPVLSRPNNIKGVLVVYTDEKNPKTVRSTDNKENKFIRFDATLENNSLDRLTDFAQEKGIRVTKEALKASAKKQRNATLGLTAGGLPNIVVNLQGEKPFVSRLGLVPSVPHRA